MKASLTALAALLAAGCASIAIAAAPVTIANPPLIPACEETEAGGGWQGGGTTLCETPGNAQLDARPSVLAQGAMGGMGGFGFI
ncbi:MAG: hypothetical protein K0U78_05030 [Actinomycetia bacterium]|nr:hypothetical protein [Actinomycetes bacterium]